MENINTTTQENIETTNDTIETADTVEDTVIDSCEDAVIHAIPEDDNSLGVVFGVAAVGAVGVILYIAAHWEEHKKKRYEKRKAKLMKEAEKYGEIVFITPDDRITDRDLSEETDESVYADENR